MSKKYPRCTVGPETARMLQLGHPWVIADRYTSRWPRADSGDVIELVTEEDESLGTALCDPGARIVARLLSVDRIRLDQQWLVRRIELARETRRWLDRGETTVMRLVNAEGDNLSGLTVDRYGDHLLIQYFTVAWERHLREVAAALQTVYEPAGIYVKHRPQETRKLAAGKTRRQPYGRLICGDPVPDPHIVRENNLFYRVDLVNDLHTGLFHDQRQNRQEFRRLAAGCRVLNLFAYTGAFSVAAAAGGAEQVTSVDASERYLDQARENFRINQIDPAGHEFIIDDCFAVLDRLLREGRYYDLVLIDPPSFSSTRKSRFTTSGGTAELVSRAVRLIPPGGLLVTSSNLQKMPFVEYFKELRKGCSRSDRCLQIIRVGGQADDFPFSVGFPEGQYLKYVVTVVQERG